MKITIDTSETKNKILYHYHNTITNLKTRLRIKNRGFYIQIEESKFNGCPRCGGKIHQFVRKSPNGICTGEIHECHNCGQWFDLVPDYEHW